MPRMAALMLRVNTHLTADEVRQIMRNTCVKTDQADADYNAEGWSERHGYGRVDAFEAVKSAQSYGNTGTVSQRNRFRHA